MTIPLNSNGHRRRELRKRVLAAESICALCDLPVDKTLTMTPGDHGKKCPGGSCSGCIPHPMRAEVDEIIARRWGGSPYDRTNTRLTHRRCNQIKGILTLDEARAKLQGNTVTPEPKPPITASPIW